MGILDSLFSSQPAAAKPAAPVPSAQPTAEDFIKNYIAAARANGQANPTSFWNWVTGKTTDAAGAAATAAAPEAWQKLQQVQQATKSGQIATENAGLGEAQNYGMASAMAGIPEGIDPKNPMASVPALIKSFGGIGPQDQGGGSAAPADPLQQQRAFYDRMGNFYARNPATAAIAKDFFALRDQGVPEGGAILHSGVPVDAVSGKPLTGGIGQVKADQIAPSENLKAGIQKSVAANQASLDRETTRLGDEDKAGYSIEKGFDTVTGQPTQVSDADLRNGKAPHFAAGDNPFFAGQKDEIKDLRGKSESADQALDMGTQIANAANGVFTGKGADTFQNVRKLALSAGQLTGVQPSDSIVNDTSKFEQLKFASQQLAAVAAHALSARTSNMLYGAITAVKPGDQTSIKGLRDIIINQVIPEMKRQKAIYAGTSAYYKAHPTANDAGAVVPDQNPLENFTIKDIQHTRPGDHYIDPVTQNIRQRPLQ